MAKIVIIDDEPAMVEVISTLCRENGHQVSPFNSAERALEELPGINPQVVIADIKMEKVTGFDVLQECRRTLPQTAVILITAYASVEKAVEAMKLGAYDFITKPFKIDELKFTVQRALDYQSAVRENVYLKKEIKNRYRFENIVGTSRAMTEVLQPHQQGRRHRQHDPHPGRERHGQGTRRPRAALQQQTPDNALRRGQLLRAAREPAGERTLRPQEGRVHRRVPGQDRTLFEEAEGGTIFLDEVNSMALSLQTKLLRVLQERMIRRVGDTKTVPINVRVVAASNEQLQAKMRNGSFREDLFYRLAVIPVDLPSPARTHGRHPAARQLFPGKRTPIRATRSRRRSRPTRSKSWAATRGRATCANWKIPSSAPAHCATRVSSRWSTCRSTSRAAGSTRLARDNIIEMPIGLRLEEFIANEERAYIEQTLRHNNGSREKTASMLGISMATLYRKLELKNKQRA